MRCWMFFPLLKVKVKVAQLCLTLCDPMDYTVHGILQARTPEWVAFPFSRGSSQPRDWTQVSHVAGGFFISWSTIKDKLILNALLVYIMCFNSVRGWNVIGANSVIGWNAVKWRSLSILFI